MIFGRVPPRVHDPEHGDLPLAVAVSRPMDRRWRVWGRRFAVIAVVVAQSAFVVRAYSAPHREFGFQMFPEASTWRADIVRVTVDGRREPISEPWDGYEWASMVTERGLAHPGFRHHADAGLDSQLAYLAAALRYVADHTPRDRSTRYLEAVVTAWYNDDPPTTIVLRSGERELDGAAP